MEFTEKLFNRNIINLKDRGHEHQIFEAIFSTQELKMRGKIVGQAIFLLRQQ